MRVGHKLGYAAAVAGGLLLATAWAAAAQNPCHPVYDSTGLSFTNCDNPDQPLPDRPAFEAACNNMYTQGFWSNPTEAAGAHERDEANAIHTGLSRTGWLTSGVVGGITWKFDADAETVVTRWGYEDPATIGQAIAHFTTLVDDARDALAAVGADLALSDLEADSEETRANLDALQTGGHHVPYYADLPYWVDHRGATPPPSFDPNIPTYSALLDPRPEYLAADLGHFIDTPEWDPTLTPALEILKCEGWSATEFIDSPRQFDDAGRRCPSHAGWRLLGPRSDGDCSYTKRSRYWQDPPGRYVYYDAYDTRPWTCGPLSKRIEIGSDDMTRTLSGRKVPHGGGYTCEYTFPQSFLQNYSLHLDEIGVDLDASSKPPTVVGHDITDNTSNRATPPTGWGVRWVEDAAAGWIPNPDGCVPLGKPCWPTFAPVVRWSPRADQLLVGTPTWVWMNNVSRSCLPNATPAAPGTDCARAQAPYREAWPADETNPSTWRHERLTLNAGNIWRAVFPQKISIELVPTGGGASTTYECWTDDNGGARTVADGAWAPGRRPVSVADTTYDTAPRWHHSDPATEPLATATGPLNPGKGDCTFVHNVAGSYTATVRIHWIGKEGDSSPAGGTSAGPPLPLVWDNPPAVEAPAVTSQTVAVVFHELHTIPGP